MGLSVGEAPGPTWMEGAVAAHGSASGISWLASSIPQLFGTHTVLIHKGVCVCVNGYYTYSHHHSSDSTAVRDTLLTAVTAGSRKGANG